MSQSFEAHGTVQTLPAAEGHSARGVLAVPAKGVNVAFGRFIARRMLIAAVLQGLSLCL